MQRLIVVGTIAFALANVLPTLSQAQESGQTRKLMSKVTPSYPQLARTINLSGKVKLLVTVAPNGKVKKVEVFGGSPVLAQAAENAVEKWKWQAASEETKEPVEINFRPE